MNVNLFLFRAVFVSALFASASLTFADTSILNTANNKEVEYRMTSESAGAFAAGAAASRLRFGSSAASSSEIALSKNVSLKIVDSYGGVARTTLSTTTKFAKPFFIATSAAAVASAGSQAFEKNKAQFSNAWNAGDYKSAFDALMLGTLQTARNAADDITFGVSGYVGQSINDYLNFDPKSPLDAYALAQAAKMKKEIDKSKQFGLSKDAALLKFDSLPSDTYYKLLYYHVVPSWMSTPIASGIVDILTGSQYVDLVKQYGGNNFPKGIECVTSICYYMQMHGWASVYKSSIPPVALSDKKWVKTYLLDENIHSKDEILDSYFMPLKSSASADDVKLTEAEAKQAIEKYISDNIDKDEKLRLSLGAYVGDSAGIGANNTTVNDAPKIISTPAFTPAGSNEAKQYTVTVNKDGTISVQSNARPDLAAGTIAAPIRSSTVNNVTNVANPAVSATAETPDVCALHPDSVSCLDAGNGDYEDIDLNSESKKFTFSPADDFQTFGTCPQPEQFDFAGKTYLIEYTQICDFASGIRPMVIAAGIFMCAVMAYAAIREV